MSRTRLCFSALSTFIMMALPSLVQAGSNGGFGITFGAAAAAGGAAEAVPLLSDTLLIVMGLLLVVLAVRTLHANKGAQKFLGVALMAGGLAVGGFGVDQTMAREEVEPRSFVYGTEDGEAACENAEFVGYDGRAIGNTVTNMCGGSNATVTPIIRGLDCAFNPDGDCGELAPGEQCTLPSYSCIR